MPQSARAHCIVHQSRLRGQWQASVLSSGAATAPAIAGSLICLPADLKLGGNAHSPVAKTCITQVALAQHTQSQCAITRRRRWRAWRWWSSTH